MVRKHSTFGNWPLTISRIGSKLAWFIIALVLIGFTSNLAPWKRKKIIDQDITYYYGYLPATFIYNDWSFFFPDEPGFTGHVWSIGLPNGNRTQKMTMGVAYLYAPFFGLAHAYTLLTGGVANGYSPNYHMALVWAGLFYFLLGIWLLRRILNQFFPDHITAIVLVLFSFGTNLFNYATWDAPLSHGFSFFLFALALLVFLAWMDHPKFWASIILGITAGLIVLIRPTNIVFLLFLAMLFLFQKRNLKEALLHLIQLRWHWLLLIGGALVVWIPQMAYWKINSGYWMFYSYLGEPFFFDKPQIINGLFSYRKGWLIYTPLMTFALIGIFMLRKNLKHWFYPVLVSTVLNIYIIFCWWCWWYGGCFGARALVEFYVVLSIPFGAFVVWISERKIPVRLMALFLAGFLIWLNLFQSRQYRSTLLHWDSMSKAAYWAIWGTQSWPENYPELLIPTDAEKAKRGEKEYP